MWRSQRVEFCYSVWQTLKNFYRHWVVIAAYVARHLRTAKENNCVLFIFASKFLKNCNTLCKRNYSTCLGFVTHTFRVLLIFTDKWPRSKWFDLSLSDQFAWYRDLAFYVMAGYLKCEGQFVLCKIYFGSAKVVCRRHWYEVYF